MMKGDGGFLGPDLSGVPLSPDDIRAAIVNPPASATGVLTTVTLKNGQKFSGLVRDEDNLSLQMLDEKGGFLLLDKADVVKTDRATTPLMPTDYGSRLSASDVQDLVAYIASEAGPAAGRGRGRGR
jgi:cytochrome c oxidase cbb3-type subunit III